MISPTELTERQHIRQACYTIEKSVKHISHHFGSMMLHEGNGFERYRHIGSSFENAYKTVRVDEEVSIIKEVIKAAVEISIKHCSAKPLIVTSNCIIRTWNKYAQTNLNVSPECTLDKFWYNGIAFPLDDVRKSILESWETVFITLSDSNCLKDEDIKWLSLNRQIHSRQKLLTKTSTLIDSYRNYLSDIPSHGR
mmetsp:Transcript_13030/g.15294  ORF Transcript_13030/g.15294 Transcript_13030/m.15294 type:complete len:195 (+) Transcript_13030:65-649(+)